MVWESADDDYEQSAAGGWYDDIGSGDDDELEGFPDLREPQI